MNEVKKPSIRVEDAIQHFGSGAELARFLEIKPQAITSWGEFVPELRAYQLRDKCPGIFGSKNKAA